MEKNNLIAGMNFGEYTYDIAIKICEENKFKHMKSGKKDGFPTVYREYLLEGFIKIACETPLNESNREFMNEVCKNIGLLMSKNKISHKVKNDSMNTLFEKNYEAVKLVISYNAYSLRNLKLDYHTEELLKIAIEKNAFAIQFIENPSDELVMKAIRKNSNSIKFINNPSDELFKIAIEKNAFAIQFIENPSDELVMNAIEKNAFAIQFIENPSDELAIKAIEKNPFAIQFIKNPNRTLIMKAIRKNAFAIKFIKNQTKEFCDLASSINKGTEKFFIKEYAN